MNTLNNINGLSNIEMLKMSGWDRVNIREMGVEKSYLVSPDGTDMYPLKNMLPKKQRGESTFSLHWSLPKGTKMRKVTPAVKKVIENSRG